MIFCFRFFTWIIFPKAPKITLGIFNFLSKFLGEICKSRCTTFGINDTSGKICNQYYWCRWFRWKICHWCQWYRQQICYRYQWYKYLVCTSLNGVHFTEYGRFHLFNSLAKTIIGLQEGTGGKPPKPAEAAASVSVPDRRFYSDRGSTSCPNRGGSSSSRGRGDGCGRGRGATRGGAGRGGLYRHDPYNKTAGAARGCGMSGCGRG